jgi:cytochrome c-type biogenesis protein CcmH/NrfF
MTLRRSFAGLIVALALAGHGVLTASAATDQNYYTVVTQFMCVACHESLNQVNSLEAIAEKVTLRRLIGEGLTLNQIKSGMVAQYGPNVLARPPAHGFNLTIYILPPAVLLGGLALLAYTLPRWRERSRRAAATKLPSATPLDTDDAKRLDDELTNFI